MNKKLALKICIVIVLIAMAVISYGPCLHDQKVVLIGLNDMGDKYPGYCTYLPQFFCIVSLIEMILAFVSRQKWPRAVGILLTVVKLLVPLAYYCVDFTGKEIGDVVFHTPDIVFYPPTTLGYVLFGLGAVTIILYIADIAIED